MNCLDLGAAVGGRGGSQAFEVMAAPIESRKAHAKGASLC